MEKQRKYDKNNNLNILQIDDLNFFFKQKKCFYLLHFCLPLVELLHALYKLTWLLVLLQNIRLDFQPNCLNEKF